MNFKTIQGALDFIQASSSPADLKIELMDLIVKHAQEGGEIKFAIHADEIQSVLFQSEHDVELTVELESVIVHAHSLSQVTSLSTQQKDTIMTTQNQNNAASSINEMEEAIAASMKKVMEASLDSVLDAALQRQKAQIDETVKKSVDEAVKKAMEEAMKSVPKDAETKSAEEPKKPTPEQTKKAVNGFVGSLGKTAAYMAGAAAVATGGYFAWKKWGGAGSTPTEV